LACRRYRSATEDYTKAIGLDPKDAFAYDARGDAYKKKGDLDRAIEDYTKAIGLYPKDKDYQRSVAYGYRAAAYLAKGDKKRSLPISREAWSSAVHHNDFRSITHPATLSNKPDPSVPPTSGSMRFSGCGITPRTLKFSE
jgi:tetratricopeptide (TPR) repeat protein